MSVIPPAASADPVADLTELAPLLRRASALDPLGLVRVRIRPESASAFVLLPFAVLAGRRLAGEFDPRLDGVFGSAELLQWLDGDQTADVPPRRDGQWRSGLPPERGWRRVETIPDEVIRRLVRAGALTLKQAADREGVPDAQPRAEVSNVLLDTVVLTVETASETIAVSLRLVSALTRMGFLARGSHAGIDINGRWLRVAADYGSVYSERPGLGLGLITPLPR